ncbi:MFS transporter [Alteromonas sp. ASW11-130]|uniref:MFS transporter n=1 Tax=Alteromonas sp. ASW11-130 TaxID=3015775 RepID=UPI002241C81F|nr:MFS transporter [Alteromonas sp. ASW11-130]MCW8093174.1 MFS transporter [Alteromonas sp. ASW11-130]
MIFSVLFLALFTTAIGQSVVITTLPSLGREAGLSEIQVAIIMSSSAVMFAIGTNLWSRVARRKGYKRTLMIGLTGYSIGTLLFATMWYLGIHFIISGVSLFVALLITRTMQSSIMSATPPSAIGYAISDSSYADRVKAISKVTSANNLGQVLGPTFAGALVGFGILTPLYSVIVLTVFALIVVKRFLPNQTAPAAQITPQNSTDTSNKIVSVKPITAMLVIFSACVFCSMAMLQQTLGFFFMDEYGESTIAAAQSVGIAMMISAASSFIAQIGIIQRATLRPEKLVQIALLLLVVAYLLCFIHQNRLVLYLAMILLGAGLGMAYPSIAAIASSRCEPEKQAAITGLITSTPAMGYIAGPLISAVLYSVDHRFPFLFACLLILLVFTLAFIKLTPRK